MKKIIIIFLAFVYGLGLFADDSEPTVSTIDGNQKVCIKGNNHTLKVKINLPIGYDINRVDSFIIKWGYPSFLDIQNGGEMRILPDKFNTINNLNLDFKFPGIYADCQPEKMGQVYINTFRDGDDKNNMFLPTFRVPPTAKIKDNLLKTCVGESLVLDGTESCPENINDYEWTIEGKKYSGSTYTYIFTTPGEKEVKLKVSNQCGSHETSVKVNVEPLPKAIAEAKADIEANKYVICLNDNEKGSLLLDGSKSENTNTYEWYSNRNNVSFTDERILGILIKEKKWAHFTSIGDYTIILKVDSECNKPDYDSIHIKVIDREPVSLGAISDTCGTIMYSPPSGNPIGTEYFVNGKKTTVFPTQLNEGNYTIKAEYKNKCGSTDDEIKFKVSEPKITKITSPTNLPKYCANPNLKIPLTGTPNDGIFSGKNIEKDGNDYIFRVKDIGIFTIYLTSGKGACQRKDSIKIEVIDNTPLTIIHQTDVCNSLIYTPGNYNKDAEYTINGTVEKNFPKSLNPGNYIIVGKLSNECGVNQIVKDTFNVTIPQNVKILSPTKDTSVCLSNTAFELKGSHANGDFSGSSLITRSGNKCFFTPSIEGTHTIIFKEGVGACLTSASVKITVVNSPTLALVPQEDVCTSLNYSVKPDNVSGAKYTINGEYFSGTKTLLVGHYIVVGTYESVCGLQEVRDTFEVKDIKQVKILEPIDSITFCLNQSPVEVKVSDFGGAFSPSTNITEDKGKYYFTPSKIEDISLKYTYGIGLGCATSDVIKISTIGENPLKLDAQGDVCNAFNYTPKKFNKDATYKIDGVIIPNAGFPVHLTDAKIYHIQAELTNECGSLILKDSFELFNPINVKIISHADKNITVCANTQKMKIQGSTNRGHFVPQAYLNIIKNDEAELDISVPGKYEIIFEQGFGDCYTSDKLTVNVENTKALTLEHQGNSCEPLNYTPNPFNQFAEYTIDGNLVTTFPITLNKGEHYIETKLTDICETKILRDTFTVYASNDLKIITNSSNRVCLNAPSILLKSTIKGATFSGKNLKAGNTDDEVYFEPKETGNFSITLSLPLENCTLSDKWTIEVIGLAPNIEDEYICQEVNQITLKGTPDGGVWSSPTCPVCITANLFTQNNKDSLYVYVYTLKNDIGCQATDTARIYIQSPKSDFKLNTAPCTSGINFDISKSKGEEYYWYVDGISVDVPPLIGLSTGNHIITMTARIGDCYDTSSVEVFIIDPVSNSADFLLPHKERCTPYNLVPKISSPYLDYLNYTWTIDYDGTQTKYNEYQVSGGFDLINTTPLRKKAYITFEAGNACGLISVNDSLEIIGIPKAIIGIDSSRFGCSPYTIALSNISQGDIENCKWTIENKIFNTCDPYIINTFTTGKETKEYKIILETSNECGSDKTYDSVTIIPPNIDVFFNTDDYKVCPNTPILFEDASTPNPIYWKWNFGDGVFSDDQNPIHIFKNPDIYEVSLNASAGCGSSTISRKIEVKDMPFVDFKLPIYSCQNQTSDSIINLSDYESNKFIWNFGNNIKDSITTHPTPIFTDFGKTDITLTVIDKKTKCPNSLTKTLDVKAQPQIDILLDSMICFGKEINIPNNTLYANDYTWYYDKLPIHSGEEPIIIFDKSGEHIIKLIASYNDKCIDSISKVIFVRRCDVYIPNVFSPNNDGSNDFFTAFGGVNTSIIRSMKIFDRWGELVFSKQDFPLNVDYLGWDGTYKTRNKSNEITSGVFVYMIEIEFTDGTRELFKGDVTLLR